MLGNGAIPGEARKKRVPFKLHDGTDRTILSILLRSASVERYPSLIKVAASPCDQRRSPGRGRPLSLSYCARMQNALSVLVGGRCVAERS